MQTWVDPIAGVGHAEGDASIIVVFRLKPPITTFTVSLMRAFVRHPDPLAVGVSVIPEQAPVVPPKPLSVGSWLGIPWRAPWRAASATVDVAQSTRKTSIEIESRKNRRGKTSANSTSAWAFCLKNSSPLVGRWREAPEGRQSLIST